MLNTLDSKQTNAPRSANLLRPKVRRFAVTEALLLLSFASYSSFAQTSEEPETEWVESAELWRAHVDDISEQLTAPAMNHCEGLVSHNEPVVVAPISQSPYMNLYLDPAFNTRNRRITNSQTEQVHRPMTNSADAWNNDESLLILHRFDKADPTPKFVLMDGNNYQTLGDLNIPAVANDTVYWSQYNPLSVFYVDNHEQAGQLKRFDIASGTQEVIADFAPICEANGFPANQGIFTKPSLDDELFAYQCGQKNGKALAVSYEYTSDEYHSLAIGADTQWPLTATLQAMPEGNGFWLQDVPLTNSLDVGSNSTQLEALTASNGKTISMFDQQSSNWKALATMGYGEFQYFANEQPAPAYFSEIVLVNTEDSEQAGLCRVAHHRSFGREASNAGYNAMLGESVATQSPSGSRVLFNSDWYDNGSVDTYAIELPSFTRLQLAGEWADKQTPSMMTRITQAGSKFAYSRALVSENETPVITTGTGRINGRSIHLKYTTKVSDKKVTGECSGTVQNDINDIAFECTDNHFGTSTYNLVRQ
ncbi:MAG: hypothetical protein AB8B84_05485 [Granulosicoccus sp.]